MTALDRFLKYIAVETASCEKSQTRPSTPGQRVLTEQLAEEMRAMGLTDVYIAEADGAAFGTIPANTEKKLPTLGFLAHVDTSEAASGKNVKARIVKTTTAGPSI